MNLTVYSDLHTEAQGTAIDMLQGHMKRRAALPNAMFACIGDVGNWVMPRDPRHMPSTPVPEIAARDDYVNAALDYQYERLKPYRWLFMGIGNHETAMLVHHGIDVGALLAQRLNTKQAGYSGFARLRWVLGGTAVCSTTILYHHGAWGGVATKGIIGAQRFAASYDGWDVFVFGHNHHCHVHHDTRLHLSQRGEIKHRDVFTVNTGTAQLTARQGGTPQYSEIRGYPPVAITAPLIKFRHERSEDRGHRMAVSVETGDC